MGEYSGSVKEVIPVAQVPHQVRAVRTQLLQNSPERACEKILEFQKDQYQLYLQTCHMNMKVFLQTDLKFKDCMALQIQHLIMLITRKKYQGYFVEKSQVSQKTKLLPQSLKVKQVGCTKMRPKQQGITSLRKDLFQLL